MNQKIFTCIFFVLLNCMLYAQTADPHASEESAITGMVSSEKILMVLDITAHDSLQYQQYRLKVEPLIEKFGGKYLVRSGGMAFDTKPERKIIPIEGNWNPDRFIIVQWNSMEELQAFANSEEYRAVADLREKSANTKSIIVKEYQSQ